ncbi:TonB family protein [Candidatus Aerophobetes bacterium]|nr:TonB family protein [Candidatus Aerophobetes bacterium]
MEVNEKNRFRFILLASCAIHFSFILLFPALGISPKLLPEYLEVYLVKLSPKQIKKPLESKAITPAKKVEKLKVTLEPKKVAPEAEKGTKTVVLEVSPVKISLPPAQKLPVLPPQVSEIEAPLVPQSLEPTFGEGIGPLPRLQKERDIGQGERLLPPGERIAKGEEGSPEEFGFPPKAISPVKEGISYGGEGEAEGQVEIRIRGPIKGRKFERPLELSYPAWAEEQGIEGEVEIKFRVSPDGIVIGAENERTSGWPELDEYVEQALMKCKFTPIKGEEIQWSIVTVEFKFGLE